MGQEIEEPQHGRDSSAKVVRTLLVDNHPVLRAGIRAQLESIAGVQVIGEAGNGLEALEAVKTLGPNIVFMDITMPVLNGLQATERITRDFPRVKVIILTRHQNEEYLWGALKRGAAGYLLKRGALEELDEAIRRVTRGEIYVSPELASQLKNFPAQQSAFGRSALDQLTDRQCEILQLIAEGHNSKEIADILHVSPKTVDFHRAKLMERLDIHDIPGLVRLALREKLIAEE